MITEEQAEKLLKDGTLVKENPVRQVYKNGQFFLKLDTRGIPRLEREWKSALLLENLHIQTVKHLSLLSVRRGGLLITEAWPQADSVADYYYRYIENGVESPLPFLEHFALFVKKILHSQIFHPDFHIGNVLYSRSLNAFALVDVAGVRPKTWIDRSFRHYAMERIVMELRSRLSDVQMLDLLRLADIPEPDFFWKQALKKEKQRLFKEWPKRCKQIWAGYAKFTERRGDLLLTVNPLREISDIRERQTQESGKAVFLSHFFLQLALIPHRRVYGYNTRDDIVYMDQESSRRATALESNDLRSRLSLLGILTQPDDWGFDSNGKIQLDRLQNVANFLM